MGIRHYYRRKSELETKRTSVCAELDEIRKQFLKEAAAFVVQWWKKQMDTAIDCNPQTAERIGSGGLQDLKADLAALTKQAPTLVEQQLARDECWDHRSSRGLDHSEAQSFRTRRDLALRNVLGRVGEPLANHGLIAIGPDTCWHTNLSGDSWEGLVSYACFFEVSVALKGSEGQYTEKIMELPPMECKRLWYLNPTLNSIVCVVIGLVAGWSKADDWGPWPRWLALATGCLAGMCGGHVLSTRLRTHMLQVRSVNALREKESHIAAIVGMVERPLLTLACATAFGLYAIGGWMALKTLAQHKGWQDEEKRAVSGRAKFYIFLAGSAVSIFAAVLGTVLAIWLYRPGLLDDVFTFGVVSNSTSKPGS